MAVQDGFGKSSGSESLVFAYDLKDTVNSYRGQPATNIWTSGNPNAHGGVVQTIQTNYFLGKVIDSGVVYRNYVTNPAQSDTSTYFNNAGLNMGSMSFNNLNPATRYIQISFDYYGVTPYRRFCCSGTGLNGYLGVTSTDSTTDTYGWDTTYSPGSGDDWNNDASRMGYWQKISLIVALRGDKNPSNIWALYIYMDAATQGDGYFTNMVFTEHSTYPTGPIRWTSGTRSNTQGLLDLTGNKTINLSSTSFDNNTQMIFDGTDDYISFGNTDMGLSGTTQATMEIVVKIDQLKPTAGAHQQVFGFRNNSDFDFFFLVFDSSQNGLTEFRVRGQNGVILDLNPNILSYIGNYMHIVFTISTSARVVYFNGQSVASSTGWSSSFSANSVFDIGRYGVGNFWFLDGNIPVTKLYNRALTSTEITNNYLKYKRQYGLT
jgi:hypothetical protein